MKRLFFLALILQISFTNINGQTDQRPIAFPTADGFGKYTTGGRGGKVFTVTNLNDNGKGSLREALEASGKRTVVFAVAGNIELDRRIVITNGNLTIAGQTAPGDGITIQNHPVIVRANNIIIRYIRVRLGDLSKREYDAMSGTKAKNIILDHCSISWGNDEVASFYDNQDFTMQWCMITEALHNSYHASGPHGYGGIFGGRRASFHHNLIAHHFARLPRFNGSRYHKKPKEEIVDFRNNVIYNWVNFTMHGGEEGNHNIVNNYFKHGPATQEEHKYRILRVLEPKGKFYMDGNFIFGAQDATRDNWMGGNWEGPVRGENIRSARATSSFPFEIQRTQTAQEAFEDVLKYSGASYCRDEIDNRITFEVREGIATYGNNGIIDSQTDVGGWPLLTSESPRKDSDGDGIPDDWELANGLDPNNPNDGAAIAENSFYTNLEIYLNSLVVHIP